MTTLETHSFYFKHRIAILCAVTVIALSTYTPARAEGLTGDVKLACEALLCLSSGTRPTECTPPLRRYFSIWNRKPHKRIRARLSFLNLCPAAEQTPEMKELTSALASGAGSCDANNLNDSLRRSSGLRYRTRYYIINTIPRHCAAMLKHEYTDYADSIMPRYVGEPLKGGYWVEVKGYEKALRKYEREWPVSRR